jgi:hypothetical protein
MPHIFCEQNHTNIFRCLEQNNNFINQPKNGIVSLLPSKENGIVTIKN